MYRHNLSPMEVMQLHFPLQTVTLPQIGFNQLTCYHSFLMADYQVHALRHYKARGNIVPIEFEDTFNGHGLRLNISDRAVFTDRIHLNLVFEVEDINDTVVKRYLVLKRHSVILSIVSNLDDIVLAYEQH